MAGNEVGDAILFEASTFEVAKSDDYCVEAGAKVLEQITEALPDEPHSEIMIDDAWASVDIGRDPIVNVSIVWVDERADTFVWALQFSQRRGWWKALRRQQQVTKEELAIRDAVFHATSAHFANVRWLSESEFRRIY